MVPRHKVPLKTYQHKTHAHQKFLLSYSTSISTYLPLIKTLQYLYMVVFAKPVPSISPGHNIHTIQTYIHPDGLLLQATRRLDSLFQGNVCISMCHVSTLFVGTGIIYLMEGVL